jgi:hypothetical protein
MFQITHEGMAYLIATIADAHPERYIEQIKTLRQFTGLGLKSSKHLIDAERDRRGPAINPVTVCLQQIEGQMHRDVNDFPNETPLGWRPEYRGEQV